ncbi:MAG: zf-HC2 domain-containing protein [Actinomycetota bacterium]|nr:zf-HC2 domain-containing protein [Actinomycetota bacterium]
MTTSDDDRRGRSEAEEHRRLRELLGAHALRALTPAEQIAVQAHLDGCVTCRAEFAEIAPLADALRLVSPDDVASTETPSSDLGARIRDRVSRERTLRERRDRRARVRMLAMVAAAVVVLGAGTATVVTELRDDRTPAVVVAGHERLALRAQQAGIGVSSAVLVPHTWGLEVRMTMTGVTAGERYRAVAVDRTGRRMPAGEFLGVSDRPVVCNMQAALLRADARAFVVLDAQGREVARADLSV